jgi:hypothetical protein
MPHSKWPGSILAAMVLAQVDRAAPPTFNRNIPTPTLSFPTFDGEISDQLARINTKGCQEVCNPRLSGSGEEIAKRV